MKYSIIIKIKQIIALFTILLLTSCALKPITSEYTFIKTDFEKVELDKLGNGKVLIYNGADILHKIDNTARLNIWLNNKSLGQVKSNEYVIINLKSGGYKFKVLHIDVFNFRSEHELVVDEKTKVIKIKPSFTSNKLVITNEFPDNFEKFKYAEKSKTDKNSSESTEIATTFDWLLGKWKRNNEEAGKETFENWEKKSNTKYVGLGFTMQNGDTIKQEKIRLIELNNNWSLKVQPQEEPESITFIMTSHNNEEFICENKELDFPNIIKYWKNGDKLNATVSGGEMKISFEFEKMNE